MQTVLANVRRRIETSAKANAAQAVAWINQATGLTLTLADMFCKPDAQEVQFNLSLDPAAMKKLMTILDKKLGAHRQQDALSFWTVDGDKDKLVVVKNFSSSQQLISLMQLDNAPVLSEDSEKTITLLKAKNIPYKLKTTKADGYYIKKAFITVQVSPRNFLAKIKTKACYDGNAPAFLADDLPDTYFIYSMDGRKGTVFGGLMTIFGGRPMNAKMQARFDKAQYMKF